MSANLLQSQTDSPGTLNWIDELALADSLLNDVTKVFKVLKKTRKRKQYVKWIIRLINGNVCENNSSSHLCFF